MNKYDTTKQLLHNYGVFVTIVLQKKALFLVFLSWLIMGDTTKFRSLNHASHSKF